MTVAISHSSPTKPAQEQNRSKPSNSISANEAVSDSNAPGSQQKPTIGADFNMFLKLLTSQIQNQNPLNPMDTSQFTQQLVQFAQTEQAIQQSGTLKSILAKLFAGEMAQASNYVGRVARFDSPVAGLSDDKPATWTYQYSQVPSSLVAEVKDSQGSVVKTLLVDRAAKGQVSWDGSTSTGARAPAGNYTLTMTAKDINGGTINGAVTASGVISSAMMLDGRAIVTVNGTNYPLDALLAIDSAVSDAAR
jgi:flagellar basal-body rod modification protein FlgD